MSHLQTQILSFIVAGSALALSSFTFFGCSSFYKEVQPELMKNRPNVSRIAQGEGLKLSQVLERSVKTAPLSEERKTLLKDITK